MKHFTVAYYDEDWRPKQRDKAGVRIRVYPGRRQMPRDYYPTPSRLKQIINLAWTHEFMPFEMRGKMRIAIKPYGSNRK